VFVPTGESGQLPARPVKLDTGIVGFHGITAGRAVSVKDNGLLDQRPVFLSELTPADLKHLIQIDVQFGVFKPCVSAMGDAVAGSRAH